MMMERSGGRMNSMFGGGGPDDEDWSEYTE